MSNLLREVKSDTMDESQLLDSRPLTEEERKRREEARKLREKAAVKRTILES